MAGSGLALFVSLMVTGRAHALILGVLVEDGISLRSLPNDVRGLIDQYMNTTDDRTRVHVTDDIVDLQWRRLNLTNGIYASQAVCDLVSHGVHGLVTALPCRAMRFVISQADAFHLPHLALTTEPCDTDPSGAFTLHLTPQYRLQARLVQAIVSRLNTPSIGLIYDSSLNTVLRNELIRVIATKSIETALIPYDSKTDTLAKLRTVRSKTFLVWTGPDTMVAVFKEAKRLKMAQSEYNWIVFGDDIGFPSANAIALSMPSSNILFVRRARSLDSLCLPTSASRQCNSVSVLKASLTDAILYYHAANSKGASVNNGSSFTAKCFSTENQPLPWGAGLTERLRKVSLSGLTKMQGFNDKGFPRVVEYGLYGASYNKANGSIGRLGNWRNDLGLRLSEGKLFVNRFQDFGNQIILISTREERPFVVKQRIGNTTVFTGFVFDILEELSSRLMFRYTVQEANDPRYGFLAQNGSWNGMIGQVVRREVAMAVGPFAITSLRESAVDFTTPFFEDGFAILTLKSQSDTGKLFQMMRPFTTDVWVSIAGAMIVVALVSFLSSYYSPYTEWRRESTHVSKKEASLKENFWIIYSSVIEQGPQFHPSGISSRCILGFWWLFTILIVSTYTANLAAFLTVTDDVSSINNLEELVNQQDMGILVQDGGNVMDVFKTSHNELYQRVWDKIQKSPSVVKIDDALDYVSSGKYAYIGMKSVLTYIAGQSCGLYAVSKETFQSGTFAIVLPENAPYKDMASFTIMKMLEGGLVDNWQQRWWPKVYNCSSAQSARTGSATSLQLDSLGGLFIVYCAITLLGFLSLLFEIAFRRVWPRR